MPPGEQPQGHYWLRYDRVDPDGKMSFRRAGRMHHLGIGAAHKHKRVLALADDHQTTVIELETGEVLLDPSDRAQELLAQPTKRARPLAELSEVRPMSRDT